MPSDMFLFWFAVLVQLLAITSVVVARLSENTTTQVGFQWLFYLCLLAVGVASMVTIHAGETSRLLCATALPVMAVGATLDLTQPRPQQHIV